MARKNVQKTTLESTSANQKTGKTTKKTLKELPWNQQKGAYFYREFCVCKKHSLQ